jgi:hypothetical protein
MDNPRRIEETQIKEILPVTPKEILSAIKVNIHPKKVPGFDLITGEILKQLPKKATVKLIYLYNAVFRLKYVPSYWKAAEVIMIPKPGKSATDVTSYRPISLLPVLSKQFEKPLLKRLKPILDEKQLIPNHQFGFRNNHSTLDQVHRRTTLIEKTLEEKNVSTSIFLDVAQAIDKIWHEGLLHKIELLLPTEYSRLLKSYLSDHYFRVKQEDEYSGLKPIKVGVPQGSVLGPVLYPIYTSDLPQPEGTTVATFADGTAIMPVGNVEEATEKLQRAADKINNWTRQWLIKLNEDKSPHLNFTNRRCHPIPIIMNGKTIPHSKTAKYLDMRLDAKLRWKEHVKKTRRAWPKIQTNVLAYGKTIGPFNTQEAGALKTDLEACMDLWHTVMGMHYYNTEISKIK